nr:MAG TPA: hypothetical protein [Bacteriophage sp.]
MNKEGFSSLFFFQVRQKRNYTYPSRTSVV